MTKASIETLVEQKVSEILAARALSAPDPMPTKAVSEEVQRRLDSIEKRLEGQDGERAEGLSYLFMAKQHQARGEDSSALKMYELAQSYFPDNEKLQCKIEKLREKLARKKEESDTSVAESTISSRRREKEVSNDCDPEDESYHYDGQESACRDSDDEAPPHRARPKKAKAKRKARTSSPDPLAQQDADLGAVTPRTQYLLDVINSRDVTRIKTLSGLGAKRAEGIVGFLNTENDGHEEEMTLKCWNDLSRLRGVGKKTLETMRESVVV